MAFSVDMIHPRANYFHFFFNKSNIAMEPLILYENLSTECY